MCQEAQGTPRRRRHGRIAEVRIWLCPHPSAHCTDCPETLLCAVPRDSRQNWLVAPNALPYRRPLYVMWLQLADGAGLGAESLSAARLFFVFCFFALDYCRNRRLTRRSRRWGSVFIQALRWILHSIAGSALVADHVVRVLSDSHSVSQPHPRTFHIWGHTWSLSLEVRKQTPVESNVHRMDVRGETVSMQKPL